MLEGLNFHRSVLGMKETHGVLNPLFHPFPFKRGTGGGRGQGWDDTTSSRILRVQRFHHFPFMESNICSFKNIYCSLFGKIKKNIHELIFEVVCRLQYIIE